MLEEDIQQISWQSWNWVFEGSKQAKIKTEKRNIKEDQKREKFLIKTVFVDDNKEIITTPTKGKKINDSNILGNPF